MPPRTPEELGLSLIVAAQNEDLVLADDDEKQEIAESILAETDTPEESGDAEN